jgi:ankyrin repeat protein
MEAQGPNGETPLHAAATSGQNDVVALLLDNGANIQAWSEGMGGTALHLACLYGHLETVKLLLNRGCHIETRTKAQGETPLMVASESGATGAVQLLLKRGADLNAVDRKGRTPLMKASGRLEVDTVRALLDAGADVSRKDTEYQCTALHDVCCTEGCPEDAVKIADLLIQKGAQADQPDGDGISSLDCAAGNGCEQLTALLINAGNNVRVSRTRLEKALIHCASDGHFNEKVATLLLQKGASVNCKDAEGYSPLMHAKELGDADAVRFLIENGADTKVPQ